MHYILMRVRNGVEEFMNCDGGWGPIHFAELFLPEVAGLLLINAKDMAAIKVFTRDEYKAELKKAAA